MTREIRIEFGDDVLFSTGMSEHEFAAEARFLLAAKLFELGRLTSGQAAKLCGQGRVEFLSTLPRIGASISNLRPEDAASEADFVESG